MTPTPSREPRVAETYRAVDLPVPESELARGAGKDTIASITGPAFGPDWSDHDPSLVDESLVIGVERDGMARAYPLKMLNLHEVVNDDLGGPLLVTFCPLCNSGLVAERRVDGEETTFHVSGLLWKAPRVQSAAAAERGDVFGVNGIDPDAEVRSSGNLVMYDDLTESYWSQILARAICGPRTEEELTPLPARTTTWGEWHRERETEVLSPPPHSATDGR
jgi:hypothetical protein